MFATEDVFGRDAASVFPNEAKKAKAASNEKILEVLGAKKFVTESELAAIKNARGLSVEDGTLNADKVCDNLWRFCRLDCLLATPATRYW